MRIQSSRTFSHVLLESLLIALGVVLALGANEWRENRNQEALADSALQSIREELAVNREAVQSSMDYHQRLVDELRPLMAQRAKGETPTPPSVRSFDRGFVSPARVLTTAWDTAKATDALGPLDYDVVLAVSRIYDRQSAYELQAQIAGNIIYQAIFEEGTNGVARN